MGISIESVWSKAQRLSASDRLALSRPLKTPIQSSDYDHFQVSFGNINLHRVIAG